MSGGGFPQSGAFYGSSQQSYYHQNGLNDFQAGQEYGKQSAFVKQGQGTGNGYQQRVDSHSQKPPEMMSSGHGLPVSSVINGPVSSQRPAAMPNQPVSHSPQQPATNRQPLPTTSLSTTASVPQPNISGQQGFLAPSMTAGAQGFPSAMTPSPNRIPPSGSAPAQQLNSSSSPSNTRSGQVSYQHPSPGQTPFHHPTSLFHPPSPSAQPNSSLPPRQVSIPGSAQMPGLPVSSGPVMPQITPQQQQLSPHGTQPPAVGGAAQEQGMSALRSGKAKRPSYNALGGVTPPLSGTPSPSRSPAPYDPTTKPTPPGPPLPGMQGQDHQHRGGPLASGRRAYPKQQSPSSIPGQPPMSAMAGGLQPQTGVTSSPQQPYYGQQPRGPSGAYGGSMQFSSPPTGLEGPMGRLTVMGGSIPTGVHPVNLMEQRHILPTTPVEPVLPPLPSDVQKRNSDPSVLCCTLNAIPETKGLLSKSKLPLGIHIHPFKDLQSLPVIHSSVITRCRSCRTYINPFVTFTDSRRWRCAMCFRVNDVSVTDVGRMTKECVIKWYTYSELGQEAGRKQVPEEFCYDPSSRTYGDPNRRPEIKSATVEFIAPSEYMLRPPQPSVFLFVLDVCFNAIDTGYLHGTCQLIKDNLDKLPGDSRTQIGFITFDSTIHFYNLKSSLSQPQMFVVSDLDDIFLPSPDDLMVNLKESKELVVQLLDSLPDMFRGTQNVHSATGAALQAALRLVGPTGGRITLFQTTLPSVGPGELKRREEPNQRASPKDVQNLTPATDFYKKFALDCAAEQVAVDMFVLAGQYADLSTLMCASKYSGGCISYYPDFHAGRNPVAVEKFENEFVRYLTRKIGFEAVMRVRATKGLSIHTFHGNFFVRSTDLVSLPNINPDSAFSMQIDIEDSLSDSSVVCFQSALLYTSSKGERRIRVHTLALPVTSKLQDVYANADSQAIAALLSKMGVDRTLSSSLGDAREALMNASIDSLSVFRSQVANMGQSGQLLAPYSLRLLPLFILALLKHVAFRLGTGSRLDERCYAMQQLKVMPLSLTMLSIYPRMYPLHDLSDKGGIQTKSGVVAQPPIYHLSGEKLSRVGIFLMDTGHAFYVWIGKDTPGEILQQVFNVPSFTSIPENLASFPELENPLSERIRNFVDFLQSERTCHAVIRIIREDSRQRPLFLQHLVDDRSESVMSYYEYLVHLQRQINN